MFHIHKKRNELIKKSMEENKRLRLRVDSILKKNNINSIAITSTINCEGKTTVVCDLASSFNRKEKEKIIIVDCNFINPSINIKFKLEDDLEEYDLLNDQASVKEYIQKVYDYVDVLTIKSVADKIDERPFLEKINRIIIQLMAEYELVIIDTSSILASLDAEIISELVDGTILVINPNKVKQHQVIAAKEKLMKSGANIIGVVINDYINGSFNDENMFI